jgi:hypothetical protein
MTMTRAVLGRAQKPTDSYPWAFGALVALLLLLLLCAAGCGSNKSGAGANAPQPAPGRAALSVTVRAEPKQGWRDPRRQSETYDMSMIGAGQAYEPVEYAALDDVVVWVEAPGEPQASQTITIDLARPSGPVRVCGTRDSWKIENAGAEGLTIYARYETGDVTDLGAVAPRATITHQPKSHGLVEILSDARPQPLARIYVAPIPTAGAGANANRARVVKSGQRVVFNDLPPGAARVTAWHPRLPGSSTQVNLAPGAAGSAALVVGVNQLPKIP